MIPSIFSPIYDQKCLDQYPLYYGTRRPISKVTFFFIP